jgi:hypothetical protein
MSDNPGMRWDIETTKQVIGYAPEDGRKAETSPEQEAGTQATARARALIEATDAWLAESRY